MNRFRYIANEKPVAPLRPSWSLLGDFNLSSGHQSSSDIYSLFESLQVKPIVIVKGRSVGMTEVACQVSIYQAINHGRRVSIVYPESNSLNFGMRRIRDKISEVNLDHEYLNGPASPSVINFKKGSIHGALNAEMMRGYSASISMRDEVDLMNERVYEAAESSLYASDNRASVLDYGTPSPDGVILRALWNESDKREYHARCVYCKHVFLLTYTNCRAIVICPNCQSEMSKSSCISNGTWIPSNPNAKRIGFRFPTFLHPTIDQDEVGRRESTMTHGTFRREIEAKFQDE